MFCRPSRKTGLQLLLKLSQCCQLVNSQPGRRLFQMVRPETAMSTDSWNLMKKYSQAGITLCALTSLIIWHWLEWIHQKCHSNCKMCRSADHRLLPTYLFDNSRVDIVHWSGLSMYDRQTSTWHTASECPHKTRVQQVTWMPYNSVENSTRLSFYPTWPNWINQAHGWTWPMSSSATGHHDFLSLIHIWRCRRIERCRSRWSPYH